MKNDIQYTTLKKSLDNNEFSFKYYKILTFRLKKKSNDEKFLFLMI